MSVSAQPFWRLVARQYRRSTDPALAGQFAAMLSSPAMRVQRQMLARVGRRVVGEPVLWKRLPGPYLRAFFPVVGDEPTIEEGLVVALVVLHDPGTGRTLYAHPVHAGPNANPLLKYLDGPLAAPKAQEGANGDRATLRLLEHKRALWDRFLSERRSLGAPAASRRWRERYFWSLIRLYFCERCPECRWGSPHFEGLSGQTYRSGPLELPQPEAQELAVWSRRVEATRDSSAWKLEAAYAARGGFSIRPGPCLVRRLDQRFSALAFPSDAEFLQGGSIVGLLAYFDEAGGQAVYAHTLCAGPEPELLLVHADRALGLPLGGPAEARAAYVAWRAAAWSAFWLDELECGIHQASRNWLVAFWSALRRLLSAVADRPAARA